MSTKFTWYGHATIGLETGGTRLVVDPFFTGNPATKIKADQVHLGAQQPDLLVLAKYHLDAGEPSHGLLVLAIGIGSLC